ncbi:rhomboid protease ROM9, putative [Plasmodium vinckei petteri]|uniref:Rhomboid protease ROM9, putative n=1 Tax=Plasmodium vinckei petteri TaxID=138298 RepID=A0A6V7T517_PLAVN|nr:rhomboid protease ROM9, putative [Plasmodium vinckei petteri]
MHMQRTTGVKFMGKGKIVTKNVHAYVHKSNIFSSKAKEKAYKYDKNYLRDNGLFLNNNINTERNASTIYMTGNPSMNALGRHAGNYSVRRFSKYSDKNLFNEQKRKCETLLSNFQNFEIKNYLLKLNKGRLQNNNIQKKIKSVIIKFEENYKNVLYNKYSFFKNMCKEKSDFYKYRISQINHNNYKNNLIFPINFFNLFISNNNKALKELINITKLKGKLFLNNIPVYYKYGIKNIPYFKALLMHHYNKSPVTYSLIFLHFFVYFLWMNAKPRQMSYTYFSPAPIRPHSFSLLTSEFMYKHFCCSLKSLREKQLYTLVTNIISHNTIQSFLLNTISLFYIGRSLEALINSKNFFFTYIVSGIISSYIQILYQKNSNYGYNNVYVLGASGSISSILATYTFIHPNHKIYLYGVLGLPLAVFSSFYFLNELYSIISNKNDDIGHASHLTGMILGIIYYYSYINRKFRI